MLLMYLKNAMTDGMSELVKEPELSEYFQGIMWNQSRNDQLS